MATKTTTAKSAATRTPKEENALKELFIDELKDIYWAEQHLVKALPKMAIWSKLKIMFPDWKARLNQSAKKPKQ